MKLCELIKNGWPEKKDLPSVAGYANDITQEYPIEVEAYHNGWNYCLAAIEPIKEMEVRIKKKAILKIIMQWTSVIDDRGLAEDIVDELAANLDKFLLIERVDNA